MAPCTAAPTVQWPCAINMICMPVTGWTNRPAAGELSPGYPLNLDTARNENVQPIVLKGFGAAP